MTAAGLLMRVVVVMVAAEGALMGSWWTAGIAGLAGATELFWSWATAGTIPRKDVPEATLRWVLEAELPELPPESDPEPEPRKLVRYHSNSETRYACECGDHIYVDQQAQCVFCGGNGLEDQRRRNQQAVEVMKARYATVNAMPSPFKEPEGEGQHSDKELDWPGLIR